MFYLCGCLCHSTCVFRGQPAWVGYLQLPCGSQGLSSACTPPSHLISLSPLLISEATSQSKYGFFTIHLPSISILSILKMLFSCCLTLQRSTFSCYFFSFVFWFHMLQFQLFYSAAVALGARTYSALLCMSRKWVSYENKRSWQCQAPTQHIAKKKKLVGNSGCRPHI